MSTTTAITPDSTILFRVLQIIESCIPPEELDRYKANHTLTIEFDRGERTLSVVMRHKHTDIVSDRVDFAFTDHWARAPREHAEAHADREMRRLAISIVLGMAQDQDAQRALRQAYDDLTARPRTRKARTALQEIS